MKVINKNLWPMLNGLICYLAISYDFNSFRIRNAKKGENCKKILENKMEKVKRIKYFTQNTYKYNKHNFKHLKLFFKANIFPTPTLQFLNSFLHLCTHRYTEILLYYLNINFT